ncbi:MAG: MgtC/SapB family protein [Burkholderiaceae bacterium]|jgi:putative Mg2+ transporter-C (MgtC) family protein
MEIHDLGEAQIIVLRLSLALLVGIVLGLNRWLHHKAAGIRTHSLVAIGSAVAILMVSNGESVEELAARSRVLQGLVAGIGFLGAGVILHDATSQKIHGLTTAASIWACALLGAVFGAGQYLIGIMALAAILLVLLVGGRLERSTRVLLGVKRESEVPADDSET